MSVGFGDRVIVGHDTFMKLQLTRYGGVGYAHIIQDFIPRLIRHGSTLEAARAVMTVNAARWLSWWRPPAVAEPVREMWECEGCLGKFDMAHAKFSKFNSNFCTIACLRAASAKLAAENTR